MKRSFIPVVFFMVLSVTSAVAQLSEGGTPRRFTTLKNAVTASVSMPVINNDMLRWQQEQEQKDNLLKPMTFAHSFEVNFSPGKDGNWNRSDDGWWIWHLSVYSEGALSLNLFFEKFHLPDSARLFIFTPGQDHLLGAFTSANNSESQVLTTAPLPGDRISVQYEIPDAPGNLPDFVISRVNHDFLGILKYVDDRRPMGVTAGECNRDVNCSAADRWREVANSVCRIMVLGKDLCTGTLVNNTSQNQKPYVLTANHCINTPLKASGTLFLFNYESPYCGSLDGDVTNSLSGSKLKATLDSLDFTLVELSNAPPPSFRPYYAGWTRVAQPSDTVVSIHHPQGDIKKIAIDNDSPVTATFLSSFVKNAFWKVLRWDVGTTEIGSSGGPFFNRSSQLIGTLSGGAAICSNPVNDYFARFDLAWNHKTDTTKQLKHWLDPLGNNPVSFTGKRFNSGENLCAVYTNMLEGDKHTVLKTATVSGGYWSGTNSEGITEIADKFSIPGDETLLGFGLGIGRKYQTNTSDNSFISVKVYNLNGQTPSSLAVKDSVFLKNLTADAINYIKFNSAVEPEDSFLIAVNFENIKPGDSLVIYQTVRTASEKNTFWLKENNKWTTFKESNPSGYAGSLAFSLLACNIGGDKNDTLVIDRKDPLWIWPNPTQGKFQIQTLENVTASMVSVYNLSGQQIGCPVNQSLPRRLEINLTGNLPGLYLLRVINGKEIYTQKVLLVSY
jgi:lysyl endopeptidase